MSIVKAAAAWSTDDDDDEDDDDDCECQAGYTEVEPPHLPSIANRRTDRQTINMGMGSV